MAGAIEDRMWDLLKQRSKNDKTRVIRIGYWSCQQLPVHKKQATDIIKSWRNRGLVLSYQNGARANLTEKGVETERLSDCS